MKQFPTENDPYMMDSCKLLWHMDRVLAWERGERIVPILIDVGLTKFCNIKCAYCYGAYQKMGREFIRPDRLIKLFKDAPRAGTKAITLTGDGEPTLNPGFYDAIVAGRANGLDIGIATNGVKLDNALTVVESAKWCRINLSAVSHEGYERVHGVRGDVYEKVKQNCLRLRKASEKVKEPAKLGLQMVLIPECLNEVVPLAKAAIAWGFDYCVIKQFSNPGGNVIPVKAFSAEEFVTRATPILREAEALSTKSTKIIVKWDLIESCNKRRYEHCIDAPFLFQVSGTGKCYPCGYLFGNEKYCYGDLHEQDYGEIIQSERYWEIVKELATTFDVHEDCKGNCRHDQTNLWLERYMKRPSGENFI